MTNPPIRPNVTYTYTSNVPPENLHILTFEADGVVQQGDAATFPPQAASATATEGEPS